MGRQYGRQCIRVAHEFNKSTAEIAKMCVLKLSAQGSIANAVFFQVEHNPAQLVRPERLEMRKPSARRLCNITHAAS